MNGLFNQTITLSAHSLTCGLSPPQSIIESANENFLSTQKNDYRIKLESKMAILNFKCEQIKKRPIMICESTRIFQKVF